MTNTRITDPESLERLHPCILLESSTRSDSGGAGLHRGGDGCVPDIEFRRDVEVLVLNERGTITPYGMAGGSPVSVVRISGCMKVVWVLGDVLGGKNTWRMSKWDQVMICESLLYCMWSCGFLLICCRVSW
ncbi:Hydantoinase B/oxoprolinase-domain-containing protein [Aspergillus californicus]